jgi:hypothetical protein
MGICYIALKIAGQEKNADCAKQSLEFLPVHCCIALLPNARHQTSKSAFTENGIILGFAYVFWEIPMVFTAVFTIARQAPLDRPSKGSR